MFFFIMLSSHSGALLTQALLHWACSFTGPFGLYQTSHALRYTLTLFYHVRKNKHGPSQHKMKLQSIAKKKKERKKTVLWSSWLCTKRCFRSEGGHSVSTNTNAISAFLLQKEDSAMPCSSQLNKSSHFRKGKRVPANLG